MKTYFDCIPCFVRQALDSARMTTDDEQIQEKVMRKVLNLTSKMDLKQSPPAMARQIHRYIREVTGLEDPYFEVKNRFNKLALQMYPELRKRVENSTDSLETALRLAIAGNIIDFGINSHIEHSHVEKAIEESLKASLDMEALELFRDEIKRAGQILYIGDNAGEIVFDRLLIEQLPCEKITFAVRGGAILNDVLIEDAQIVGLTDIVDVIDNGSDTPGIILEDCSDEFRRRFDEADMIIAKGQGNYETLSDIDKNIFFLVRPKCAVLARHLGSPIGSLVLAGTNHRKLTERS